MSEHRADLTSVAASSRALASVSRASAVTPRASASRCSSVGRPFSRVSVSFADIRGHATSIGFCSRCPQPSLGRRRLTRAGQRRTLGIGRKAGMSHLLPCIDLTFLSSASIESVIRAAEEW